jgi:hypothetical protein
VIHQRLKEKVIKEIAVSSASRNARFLFHKYPDII